ncbi:MAG: ribosomal L7Ae/L30e/S12e/Gadd45 family protein [Candidatus Nanoarchaeia archaeon]
MTNVDLLLKALKEKTVLDGAREIKKAILNNKVEAIFITSNCPDDIISDLEGLAKMHNIKVYNLNLNAEQLAAQLKRPYNSSVLAILKSKM